MTDGRIHKQNLPNELPVSNRNKPDGKVEATIDVFFDGTYNNKYNSI